MLASVDTGARGSAGVAATGVEETTGYDIGCTTARDTGCAVTVIGLAVAMGYDTCRAEGYPAITGGN